MNNRKSVDYTQATCTWPPTDPSCSGLHGHDNNGALIVSIAAAAGIWVFTAFDAGGDVRKFNATHRLSLVPIRGGVTVNITY